MDLISVIVPIYNVELYLNRCIESIVGQTYGKLEIILVDDGSSDKCPSMCDAWLKKDSRIKVIHKKNGGLSDARNAGLAVAKGEFIAFVDSDDWIHPKYVELLYNAIRKFDAEISACDVRVVYEGNNVVNEQIDITADRVYSTEQALEMLIRGIGFRAVAWNKLYHRKVLDSEKFTVGRYHEDEFLTYKLLAKAERLAFVNTELYFYFQRSGSIMNSISTKHLDALDAYFERLEFLQNRYPKLYHEDKSVFCNSCLNFYQSALLLDGEERKRCLKKIKTLRAGVHFSLRELWSYSLREIICILGSRLSIDLLCRILILKRKKNSENISL